MTSYWSMSVTDEPSFDTPPEFYAPPPPKPPFPETMKALDIDPWESPANVQTGVSTVSGQDFVNPVGAAPAPGVQAAPAFVGEAQVVPPAYQHLTRTTPEYTQSIVPPDTRSPIEKALAMLGDTPLPGLSGGMYGGRGKTSDLGTAYNTEIPYYTDFARGTIQPALGQLGELAGTGVDMQSGGLSQLLNRQLGTPTTAQAGRFAGEAFAPVTLGDVALGAATGNVTGFDDLIKSGVMSATKSYADNALRAGLGAVPEGAVARTVAEAAPMNVPGGIPRGISPTEGTGIMRTGGAADDIESWEYSLKRLQAAKEQGPEAFAAEKARQAQVASGKVAETQATNAANARTRFSNTSKAQLEDTRAAMEAAQARLKPGSAISAADDATTSGVSAGRSVGSPPSPSTGTAARKEAERAIFGDVVDELPDMPGVAGGAVGLQGAPTAAQMAAIAHFTDMTRGVIDNNSTMQRLYESVRPLTRFGSGDLADSRLAEMVARSAEFKTLLSRTAGDFTPEEIDQATALWRNSQLKRMYPNKADYDAAVAQLTKNATPPAGGTTDSIQEVARSAMLSADFSVLGQQLEASVRRGGTATMTGILNDAVNRIAAQLHLPGMPEIYIRNDIDKVSQAIADGLQMGGGQTADIAKSGLAGKLAPIGKALDGLAELQYGKLMGSVRLRTYEGLLQQNQILHKISGGKFGGDITDPLVRRHIAEYANTVGSTARKASNITRATGERRLMLSPAMTRSQINEVLTPLKSLRSTEDAINTINLVASTALVLAGGKALNDAVGITEWEGNPLGFGFGSITLPIKDGDGRNRVISILPQASFEKALLRSVAAFKKGDMEALADAWERYGAGRLNIAPSAGLRTAGVGYDSKGKFHGVGTGDERMSLGEAAKASLPIPLTAKQIAEDPTGAPFAITGQTEFSENQYGSADRYAQDLYGGKFYDLDVRDQAAVNAKMAADGVPLDDWKRAGPYFGADDKVFQSLREKEPSLAAYEDLTAFRSALNGRLNDRGILPQDQEAARKKIEKAIGLTDDAIKAEKLRIISKDPAIVDALQKLYEDGELDFPPAKYLREFVGSLQTAGVR